MGDSVEKIYLSPPYQSGKELQKLTNVFESNWLAPFGDTSQAFKQEVSKYIIGEHIVLTNSATSALHLALQVLQVNQGDVVLCPTYTFAASAFAIVYQKAIPVFVDVDPITWNMNPAILEMAIKDCIRKNTKPKAIIVVHNYGNPVDWDSIESLSKTYEIPVIEDAAEALGSSYRHKKAGSLSELGVFSFNANKIITTSGGGSLQCRDLSLIHI